MNKAFVRAVLALLILFHVLFVHAQVAVKWTEVHPGVWKAVIGKPEAISLLKAAGVSAYEKGFASLPAAGFPLDRKLIVARQRDGKIYLRLPLQKEEKIFGFGLNFQTVNQRGRVLHLHVDHYGGKDNGRTHAPAPFYVSSSGYGVLVDAARYMTVYVGTAVRVDSEHPPLVHDRNTDKGWEAQPYSDAVEVLVPAQGVEVYVFGGPSPMNAVQRYNLMNGGGCLPPKWGLGFTERMPTLSSQTDIVGEVKLFEQHDFPLDVIGVEPGWQSMAYPCTFEWDKSRFPDPAGFIKELSAHGVRANLWTNPYISPKASLYPAMKALSGSHTVWNGLVPDLSLPAARKLLKEHFLKEHINIGVSGYKIDEIDGYDNWLWPDVATFPSGYSGEQMRQVYGLLAQRMTTGWFKEKNQRTYGLIRASNAGASSFPYVIYDDYYSHKDFITALVNSSFAGVLWTPEVRASKSAEEWVRRMQSVCFSPMAMLNAWADGTKPWSFPEVEGAVKEVASLRMQLIPYIYSVYAQYRFEGKPPFRAMNLVEGSETAELKDQYMMGDNILVAPMFTGEKTRKVWLPAGKWYDFYTGELAGEHETITITPGLDKIPLFVRDGGIIPMMPAQRQAPKPGQVIPLIIRHYGSADGSFVLYDDDGVSYDYEKGAYSFVTLRVQRDGNGGLAGSLSDPPAGKPYGYAKEVSWVFMTRAVNAQSPRDTLPTPAQIQWSDAEIGVLFHLDMQVFEPTYNFRANWNYHPSLSKFNPRELSTDQWIRAAKSAGAKYAILVAKHGSGFSLWPTKAHGYSVKNTPWRNGKGDIVKDFIASCKKYGIKPGIYASASTNGFMKVDNPGRVISGKAADQEKYQQVLQTQLTELWSQYGPLFEIWFDGGVLPADKGGIDMLSLIKKYQPGAIAFQGPYGYKNNIRWVGNENGVAPYPCWCRADSTTSATGTIEIKGLEGNPDGAFWCPGESDFPLRDNASFEGGWFWAKGEDDKVRTVADLHNRYDETVGRNTNMLIGVVVDNRGLVPDRDAECLAAFGKELSERFNHPLGSTSGRGYSFVIDLDSSQTVKEAVMEENISLGQRVREYKLYGKQNGVWVLVGGGMSIGHKRIETIRAGKYAALKLDITRWAGEPVIRNFQCF